MKTLFLTLCLILALATPALADPYLTCDDMPGVDTFVMELDGVEQPPSPAVAGHAWVDLAPVSAGSHTVRLKAKNIWGEGPYSDPFAFTKALPGKPSGLGLRAE